MAVEAGNMVLIGIGELYAAPAEGRTLVARCLGSSVALAVHDPQTGIAGMIHWMLPDSRINPARAEKNPSLFADTGIPCLMGKMEEQGAEKSRLRACLAGGASLPEGGAFDVGIRNRESGLRALRAAGVPIDRNETGGVVVRELCLETGPGDFIVRSLNV